MPLKYHHGYNTGNTIRRFPMRLQVQECHDENYVPLGRLKYDRDNNSFYGRSLCLRCGFRCFDPDCPGGKKALKKLKGMKKINHYELCEIVDTECSE